MEKLIEYVGDGIGWQSLAVIVCLIITGLPSFIKGFDYLVDRFGIETKGMRKRKENNNRINNLEQKLATMDTANKEHWQTSRNYQQSYAETQREIIYKLSSITDKIDALQNKIDANELQKLIERYRAEIINFASNLSNPSFRPTKDHYDNIFRKYEEYEKVLEEHGLENGQTDISMRIVRNHYQEALERGDFIEHE